MEIKYSYKRYGTGPGINPDADDDDDVNNDDSNLANHHILPYHLMYLFGILCVTLAKRSQESARQAQLKKKWEEAEAKAVRLATQATATKHEDDKRKEVEAGRKADSAKEEAETAKKNLAKQGKDVQWADNYDYRSKLLALYNSRNEFEGTLDILLGKITVVYSEGREAEYIIPKPAPALGPNGQLEVVDPLSAVMSKICWTHFNLFLGPRGSLRNDDPSQHMESTRPNSFKSARWEVLVKLNQMYKDIGIRSADQTNQEIKYKISYAAAQKISQYFLDNVKKIRPHQTLVSDWVVADMSKKKYSFSIDLAQAKKSNETSTRAPRAIVSNLYFCCKSAGTPESDTYYSVAKPDGKKFFAIKRQGQPSSEHLNKKCSEVF